LAESNFTEEVLNPFAVVAKLFLISWGIVLMYFVDVNKSSTDTRFGSMVAILRTVADSLPGNSIVILGSDYGVKYLAASFSIHLHL